MSREEIIIRLRQNEARLRQRGVAHAGLLGSRARGDQRADSDMDIMIECDPAARSRRAANVREAMLVKRMH